MKNGLVYLLYFFFFSACVEKAPIINSDDQLDLSRLNGSGSFVYTGYAPFKEKPITVYFYIPPGANAKTPILFAFHGTERIGSATRNAFVNLGKNCIVLVPEFSENAFPGGDAYNLGNIFVDGDNPSVASLNKEEDWTFSVLDPIFEYVKTSIQSQVLNYDMFGHSAGAQFAQRFLLFKPQSKIKNAVISAAGWYTMVDSSLRFPYGIKDSPAQNYSFQALFSKNVFVIVGENDNNPNAADLRRNDIVDLQGINRLTRANYFYLQTRNTCLNQGFTYNWKYQIMKNVGHDNLAASAYAASLLYP